jgi:hypothetical protein
MFRPSLDDRYAVVEYADRCKFQARAAEKLISLPDGSATAEMLSYYAVLRDQVRVCSRI